MVRKLSLLGVCLVVMLTLVSVVQAEEVMPQRTGANKAAIMENKAERTQARAERSEQRCEIIANNIAARVARFANNKQYHIDRYNHATTVTKALIEKAQAEGKNTTGLENALTALDTEVKTFAAAAVTYNDSLVKTQGLACGESEGAFANQLKIARENLLKVREAASQVKLIYQSQVRPAVQALRN